MRISTSSILRNYTANVTKSMSNLEQARTRVATMRNFSKTSEDPAASTKAFQLRRDYMKNEDHLENIKMAQAKFTTLDSGIKQINDMALQIQGDELLTAVTGTTSLEQRQAIAKGLDQTRESMMLSLNAKDGDKYVFGGSNTKYAPFTLSDSGDLMYYIKEDKDATTGVVTPVYARVDDAMGADGKPIQITDENGDPKDFDLDDMKKLADEKLYLDTGFGLQMKDGQVVAGTALNVSYPAINVIGFGKNADGTPNNMISLLKQLSEELTQDTLNTTEVDKLRGAFTKAKDKVVDHWTAIGTMDKFLQTTEDRLIDNRINLNTKIVDIEQVNMEEAISEFEFAKYAYNAALKVGMSILQPSFIDFMS